MLGATGAVGQRFVQMLSQHPWFELTLLTGKASAGKKYGDAVKWRLEVPVPEEVAEMEIKETSLSLLKEVDLVFSALPSSEARTLEPEIMKAGIPMVSNSSALRLDPIVPLVIPDVNPDHLGLIDLQREKGVGPAATDPNCTTTMAVLPLKALQNKFEIERVDLCSYQALSGAGFPGVPSYDILDNLIPYIPSEEEKVMKESRKLLGSFTGSGVKEANLRIQATCVRVPVLDGHLIAMHVDFQEEVSVDEVRSALAEYVSEPQRLNLPTAPERPIVVRDEPDRPQPRYDRWAGKGMSVTVGRIRRGASDKSILMLSLGHNTVRGAAGQAILLAELMKAKGYL